MKKISLLLALLLCVSALFGCAGTGGNGGSGEESKTGTEAASGGQTSTDGVFSAGYARSNITPEDSVPLAGYGNTDKRLSNGFLDYIYLTCLAFTDENGDTLLWFSQDLAGVSATVAARMKKAVSEATGVDIDHILITATHTHSCVDQGQTGFESVNKFITKMIDAAPKTALDAMADCKPATFKWGTADLTGYNYVRHYFTDLDESVGDNHGSLATGKVNRHTSEANHIAYLLEIDREGAQPILAVNWRAHATITGGGKKGDISADFIGSVRTSLEKKTDYLFVYYQGEAGNINPRTRLSSEVEFNPPKDFKEYGDQVSDLIIEGIGNGMTQIKTGPIQTISTTFTGEVNHEWDSLAGIGQELRNFWNETWDTTETIKRGMVYGIESPYHASAIATRAGMGKTHTVEIHVLRIGDYAMAMAPFELFDTNGNYVHENSPSAYTMVVGYSNEGQGYLPSQYAYEYGCYEADTGRFKPGTGELLAERYVELLNGLFE